MRAATAAVVAGLAVATGGTALAASGSGGTGPSAFLDAVAIELGISSERLAEATKAAAVDEVDAQLKAGTITQAQAEAMKERIQSSDGVGLGFGPGFGGPHDGHGGPGGHLDDAAAFLGLTTDALVTQLQDGKTLGEVARAAGKSVDGLKAALLASERAELAEAVADGRLTQAQADEILAGADERLDDLIAGTMPQHGHRGFGPPAATQSATSETGASI
jgi:hypothetical protein